MGGLVSIAASAITVEKHVQAARQASYGKFRADYSTLIEMMLPAYFVRQPLTEELLGVAKTAWKSVLDNSASRYLKEGQASEAFLSQYPTALEFFANNFFTRLHDVHPTLLPMLAKLHNRNKFMCDMVAFVLTDVEDEAAFESVVYEFTKLHHVRGVRSTEYGIVGEVLLHTFSMTLGPFQFSPGVYHAWVVAYSRLLNFIMPAAIALDLSEKDNNGEVNKALQNSYFEVLQSVSDRQPCTPSTTKPF